MLQDEQFSPSKPPSDPTSVHEMDRQAPYDLKEQALNDANKRSRAGYANHQTRRGVAASAWVAVALFIIGGGAWLRYSHHSSHAAERPGAPALPQVIVSKPLEREVDASLGFLGQFSAVDEVELRAQVGGTLTEIHFKDGDVVHRGDLLFTIDPIPYDIRLAQANAQLESAVARLDLANRELVRAQNLKSSDAGTVQNVDQRLADRRTAQAAIDQAKAQIRDAQFDLEHCRITAPFTGRIGTHLVSVGNLIAGSRASTSPTTLLATIVTVDPIYLNFDMSESDYLTFSRGHAKQNGPLADKIELALGDETGFGRQGTLNFVDNVLDRSSGTLHARATVSNASLLLTPGEFARVRLVLGAPVMALLVPDTAVLPDQSEHLVLTVATDGTVVAKQVQTGDLRGGLRVIRSGLGATDKVIIGGIPYAAPGSKVAPQDGTIKLADATTNNK
ncbi:efflux RND transporter periplasmic adaptor subunit [Acidisphaera sp. L21]|uniref:efflux RND transporter periplasmic adaptor subunit n=1 Tax=Acidisphaera sp. L21 TaxID=1641851 RepID=UPI001C208079|nr:efflux RND transporter periplasmic adaptor subunit [Acidisphaera sp. L21]